MDTLRDAFLLADHDNDGAITPADLRQLCATLGIPPPTLDPHARINLTMFLAMMRERLDQLDPEQDLVDAFECFDDADTGLVKVDEMRKWLADVGERMAPHEIDAFLAGPFTDRHGNFNYRAWIKSLCEARS